MMMKKIFSAVIGLFLILSSQVNSAEKLSIEKQLVGIVGAINGTVKTETRTLKAGDSDWADVTWSYS